MLTVFDSAFSPKACHHLHTAASLGGLPAEGVMMLLAAGCDTQLRDERGQTAERVAQAKNHDAVARMLSAHARSPPLTEGAAPGTADPTPEKGPATGKGGRGRRRRGGRGAARRAAAEQQQEHLQSDAVEAVA